MSEEFLDSANVIPVFQQMRGKRMPKRVRACRLGYPRFLYSLFHRFLQYGFVQMMSASLACYLVGVMAGCRKYPLPTPLFPCVRIFALKRIGQSDSAHSSLEIALVLPSDQLKVLGEWFFYGCGKHRVAILVPFASPNYDLVSGEIDILHPQLQTFHQSEAGMAMSQSELSMQPKIDLTSCRVKTVGSLFGLFARTTPST